MPATVTRRAPSTLVTRAISARPTTWRDSDRSIEAVAATETPVRSEIYDYDRRGWFIYDEVIDVAGMSEEDVASYVGCSVLDSHSTYSAHDIVGVITESRKEGTELIVRLSIDESEPTIVSKVKSGTIRKVSIGYKRKPTGAVITEREGAVPLRRQPIEPVELSLVAVGADPNAGTRSASIRNIPDPAPAETQEDDSMPVNVDAIRSATAGLATAVAALQAAVADTSAPAPVPAADDAAARAAIEAAATRSQATPPVVQGPAPVATPSGPTKRSADDEAVITGFRAIATNAGRADEFELFVRAGRSVDGLAELASTYVTTTRSETNGIVTSPAGGDTEQWPSFDELASGKRSGDDKVTALAAALSSFMR